MRLDIDLILFYAQGATISFVGALVVGVVMRRSPREFVRFAIAGVAFGTMTFAWSTLRGWKPDDVMGVTFFAGGFVDIVIKFLVDFTPKILKHFATKNGIPEAIDPDPVGSTPDPGNGPH